MSLFNALFQSNPMLIEVRRYRRRFFGSGRMRGANVAMILVGAISYIGLLLIVGNGNGGIPPIAIVSIQTGLFVLAAPSILNGSIAGEREKRTWDLLLVAPVTKAQIMIGKFAGAMMNLLLGATLFALPTIICAVTYRETRFGNLLLAEANSLAFGVLACATSIFFSARCNRAFTALAVTLGVFLVTLIVYPMLVAAVSTSDATTTQLLLYLHPFMGEIQLIDGNWGNTAFGSAEVTATVQAVIYLALAAVALVWTERTLTYSDNEVKFLPKRHA